MTLTLFLICTAFFCIFLRKWRSHLGYTFFGMVAFYVICVLWIPYYMACDYFLSTAWEYPIKDLEMSYITSLFAGCVILCNLSLRLFRLAPVERKQHLLSRLASSSKGRTYMCIAVGIPAACIVGLYATKGVALNVGHYGSRFESNTGTGVYAILSYAVVSFAVLRLFIRPRLASMLLSLVIVIGYGIALFLTLGGERNYLIAAVVPVLLASYSLKIIRERQLVLYLALGVVGLTSLAMIRYGDALASTSYGVIAMYTRDTIFPVQSLKWLFYNSSLHFVGFEYFIDQFYSTIPRALWPGKPIYLNTISYYFTEQVLVYGKGLIIAPTGLGSLYLMGGWLYVAIGMPLIFIVFFCLDYFVFNGKSIIFICLWPSLFFAFFCFRESFELGIFKILVHALGTLLIYCFAMGVYRILPKKKSEQAINVESA